MTEEKLPDRLPKIAVPLGSYEWKLNSIAEKYNSLDSRDPQRKNFYEEWKNARSENDWD